MSNVYITEHGCTIGINGGNIYIRHKDQTEDAIPKELVDGISIFAKSSMTTQCIQYCLENGIRVSYFAPSGKYYGSLIPNIAESVERLRKQFKYCDDESFSLQIGRNIVHAKIYNQLVVVKRYIRSSGNEYNEKLFYLKDACKKALNVKSKAALLGYEGIASKTYFNIISDLIEKDFAFGGRSKRSASDPFNIMLNIGYSLLTKEISGEIINHHMTPYVGFLHENREKSPALACDLIEEWRPVIVDSVVLSLIQGHEICLDMFEEQDGHIDLNHEGIRILLSKLEAKMHVESRYLAYIGKPVTFRAAIGYQIDRIGKAIDNNNFEMYVPIKIR